MVRIITHIPTLRQKSLPILTYSDALVELIDNMKIILKEQDDPPGVGLSAIQVGVPVQVVITHYNDNDRVFLNPQVVDKRGELKTMEEGCLSLPGILIDVSRNDQVVIEFDIMKQGLLVHKRELFAGMMARIMQHEIDHLNGVLIRDYVVQ